MGQSDVQNLEQDCIFGSGKLAQIQAIGWNSVTRKATSFFGMLLAIAPRNSGILFMGDLVSLSLEDIQARCHGGSFLAPAKQACCPLDHPASLSLCLPIRPPVAHIPAARWHQFKAGALPHLLELPVPTCSEFWQHNLCLNQAVTAPIIQCLIMMLFSVSCPCCQHRLCLGSDWPP